MRELSQGRILCLCVSVSSAFAVLCSTHISQGSNTVLQVFLVSENTAEIMTKVKIEQSFVGMVLDIPVG